MSRPSRLSLVDQLGYSQSQKFITPDKEKRLPRGELSFAIRRILDACNQLTEGLHWCRFQGVYVLQRRQESSSIPIIYLFDADEASARKIHKIIWNQNLVPFIVVSSTSIVRVYPGFEFDSQKDRALLSIAAEATDLLDRLVCFTSDAIDSGKIWDQWGQRVDPSKRVDEKLLADLKTLDALLQKNEVPRTSSHNLIGKFVYLYYLRHRDILSDRKLEKWGLDPESVFGRLASLKAFRSVNRYLQDWLNGSVFQLGDETLKHISSAHFQLVGEVFHGDSPHGQLHLDFQAYDFSHIPIETLSCVYEQFLHDTEAESGPSRGKELGAYYTPVPLADYVISEMESKRPLTSVSRVLDPSCGSGTFLVGCYRRLIEQKVVAEGRPLKASELREILTDQIFGIDRDDDACKIAELSLILTLLDYVHPPDLENSNFKLPALRDSNIFQGDFFSSDKSWTVDEWTFDWVVGNPPWAEVKGIPAEDDEHYEAWQWMEANQAHYPIGGRQIAEAFLWKARNHLEKSGVAGLLVPAMTWFKKESKGFRTHFFAKNSVWCLANFSNFMEVLFAGRSRSPASTVFYQREKPALDHAIETFAPFVAEQVANRPNKAHARKVTWNIVVNGAEVRTVDNVEAVQGDARLWKFAMWGATPDVQILNRIEDKFSSFSDVANGYGLLAHQGLELKRFSTKEELVHHPELEGKLRLVPTRLRGAGKLFAFPRNSVEKIDAEQTYLRKGRESLPMQVSTPPHLIIDAARRFFVFSDRFIAVPHWYIGINGPKKNTNVLKALGLYFSSDFCRYHQFFVSQKWGIDQNYASLDSLKKLPIAIPTSELELADWAGLYDELVEHTGENRRVMVDQSTVFEGLIRRLNERVYACLGLRDWERWVVEDFVAVNMEMRQGAITDRIMERPTPEDLQTYFESLCLCLDRFIGTRHGIYHQIHAIVGGSSGFFSVCAIKSQKAIIPKLRVALQIEDADLKKTESRLRRKHSQWLYFDRNLRVYDQGTIYVFKPMQMLHWSRRQAVLDSEEIIGEILTSD